MARVQGGGVSENRRVARTLVPRCACYGFRVGSAVSRLAWINVALHVVAIALAAIGMRPGTAIVPLAERIAYLSRAPAGWTLGWGSWMLCALALVALFAALAHRLDGPLVRLGLVLAGAGAAIDLLCDDLQLAVLPEVARRGNDALFLTLERAAGSGGTVVANGLYTIAGLLVTLRLRREAGLSRVVWVGYGVFVSGMSMVAAGLAGEPRWVEWVTGPTIGLYCLWCLGLATRRG